MNAQLAGWITNFGDTGVILPLSALLTLVLWRQDSARSAWLFGRSLLGCLVIMAALKILFLSCGHSIGTAIRSPSGHTSLTTFFYGAIATLFWARRPGAIGISAILATLALILGVGFSRLVLHAHNLPEVVLGSCVGFLMLTSFAIPYLRQPHPALHLRRIALFLLPLFLLTYGTILPAERMLHNFIPWFRVGICAA